VLAANRGAAENSTGVALDAEEVMATFDVDGDGTLDAAEIQALQARLSNSVALGKGMDESNPVAGAHGADSESSEDSDDDIVDIVRKRRKRRAREPAKREGLADVGGMHNRLGEDWSKIGGEAPEWDRAKRVGGWAYAQAVEAAEAGVPLMSDAMISDSALQPEDVDDCLRLTCGPLCRMLSDLGQRRAFIRWATDRKVYLATEYVDCTCGCRYCMMEKLNALTKFYMVETPEQLYERQFSEVNNRIDKLSEALKRSAFASSRYHHAEERQTSRGQDLVR
jgi:hypothetical protein